MPESDEKPLRVYIIDDHKSILWGLERLIESASPEMRLVGLATTWSEALPQVIETEPDIILLDLDLGKESGLDAIPKFTALNTSKVIVVTGIRDPAKHDSAIVLGARGVIEKEDSAETILTAIRKVYEGQTWLPRMAVDRILSELSKKAMPAKPTREQVKINSLTTREREIVEAVANNPSASTKKIAAMLFISEHTLRNHLTSIYSKLGVSSRLELYAFAKSNELARRPDGTTGQYGN